MAKKQVSLIILALLLVFSSYAVAEPHTIADDIHGCSIRLSDNFALSKQFTPRELGAHPFLMYLFAYSLPPVDVFSGSTGSVFMRFVIRDDTIEGAESLIKEKFTRLTGESPSKTERFRLNCPKTKAVTFRYALTRRTEYYPSPSEYTFMFFVAQNSNGIFAFMFGHFSRLVSQHKSAIDDARTIAYLEKRKPSETDKMCLPIPDMRIIETENYLLQHNLDLISDANRVAKCVERFRTELEKIVPPIPIVQATRTKTLIRYFKDHQSFIEYLDKKQMMGEMEWYNSANNEIYYYKLIDNLDSLSDLYRACTYQYIYECLGGRDAIVHPWVLEGLAEYLSNAGNFSVDEMKRGAMHKIAREKVKSDIICRRYPLLRDVRRYYHKNFEYPDKTAYYYSWSLVNMLVSPDFPQYNDIIKNYIYELSDYTRLILKEMYMKGVVIDCVASEWIDEISDVDIETGQKDGEHYGKYYLMLMKAANDAHASALKNFDMNKLQREWKAYYR